MPDVILPPVSVPKRGLGTVLLMTLLLLATLGLGAWLARLPSFASFPVFIGWAFAAFFFGTTVGLSEILSRYRDEPILAARTLAGFSYLALNGFISLIAFVVLRKYPNQIFPALSSDLAMSAVVAGFGAMIIFRSKLFTFKSADGNEYPIGPSIVLDTVLKMIDSKIDRHRASERQARVFSAVLNIQDFPRMADYIEASLPSFQNLSTDDKKQIADVTSQYRASRFPDTLKGLGLGFAFLTIAGEANFDLVISNIQQYAQKQQELQTQQNQSASSSTTPAALSKTTTAPSIP